MFEELYGEADEGTEKVLQVLEGNMIMLSTVDQEFVIGCRQHLQLGGILTADNKQRLQQIAGSLSSTSHNTLGIGAGTPALSMQEVLRAFANNLSILSPQEKHFAAQMAQKLRSGKQLSLDEMQTLLSIYTAKGF